MTRFSKKELEILGKIMEEGEEVLAVSRQSRLSKLIAPSIALATSKRVAIIKRDLLGIRSDIHFIPYDNIVSFRLVHGFVFSSVKLRLMGSVRPDSQDMLDNTGDETEIRGLNKKDAHKLAAKINERLNGREKGVKEREIIKERKAGPIINIFYNSNIINTPGTVMLPGVYLPHEYKHTYANYAYANYANVNTTYETSAQETSTDMQTEETVVTSRGQEVYALAQQDSAGKAPTLNSANKQENSTHIPTGNDFVKIDKQEISSARRQGAGKVTPDEIKIFAERESKKSDYEKNKIKSPFLSEISFLKNLFAKNGEDNSDEDPFLDEVEKKAMS